MKKLLSFVSVLALFLSGCTAYAPTVPTPSDPVVTEVVSYNQYTHPEYTVGYPSELTPVERGDSYVGFEKAGEAEFGIRIQDGETKYYLDQEPVSQVTFQDGPGNLFINKTGYCDGPSCSPSYIAYSLYNGTNTYILEFFNQTTETETSRQVMESFLLKR